MTQIDTQDLGQVSRHYHSLVAKRNEMNLQIAIFRTIINELVSKHLVETEGMDPRTAAGVRTSIEDSDLGIQVTRVPVAGKANFNLDSFAAEHPEMVGKVTKAVFDEEALEEFLGEHPEHLPTIQRYIETSNPSYRISVKPL